MQNNLYTDVLVVGGGAAGVAAAVAASTGGATVMLVEQHSFLGGKATAAEVGTVCGLYKFVKQGPPAYIVDGFAKRFAEALSAHSRSAPACSIPGLFFLPYDNTAFKDICFKELHQFGVHILLNTSILSVSTLNNTLTGVVVRSGNDQICIQCRAVVDCTGNSSVSQLAKLPVITGEYQAAAQVFTLENIDTEQVTEQQLGFILMKLLAQGISSGALSSFHDRLYIVPGSMKHGCISLKAGLPVKVTYLPGNAQALKEAALAFIETVTAYLVSNSGIFKNARLEHMAPEPGTRTAPRGLGLYQLSETDVLSGARFTDAIANGTWPIENWGLDRRVQMRYLPENSYYQIPAGCLISRHADNLFFAGRNISASEAAIASARVMGICMQTGYAAGRLAAAKALQSSLELAIKTVQEEQLPAQTTTISVAPLAGH